MESRSTQTVSASGTLLALGLALVMILPATPALADHGPPVSVIVIENSDAGDGPEQAVALAGGTVGDQLPIIGGFTAVVPDGAIPALVARSDVLSVTPDSSVYLMSDDYEMDDLERDDDDVPIWSTEKRYVIPVGDMDRVARLVNADDMWRKGYTGQGIDVALIDSGVVPVEGLTYPGKVINGIDLSFESQAENLRYMDTFGHGTHIAGIIAGRDKDDSGFRGIAPGSRIISIKVADAFGAVDVSQVIAAIDWVVQHRTDNGMNIRVLNLSFGTDSTQSYLLDPLAFAVEQAWQEGIVVVVSAGNDGNGVALRNPAMDPYVIAVGSVDPGIADSPKDDVVSEFSNCGISGVRTVDLVAPGRSIESLRSPGAYLPTEFPNALIGTRLMKGSGTSQAAAVVSGGAALLLSRDPGLTPDEVKVMLMKGAAYMPNAKGICQGAGALDILTAATVQADGYVFKYKESGGNGSLDEARGSFHLEHDGVVLKGEQDIFGNKWDAKTWAKLSASGASWSGGEWNGASWSGASWSGASWSGASWSGASWSGASWSGASWSGASWSGASWSGASWSGASWSGASWSGASWSGASWSGASWSGASWSGASWSGASWSGGSWSGMWLGLSWT